MALYLGNILTGNGNYLGDINIPDNSIFVPATTTTTTAAPTTTSTTTIAPQYWNVRQCGTTEPITQLGIQFGVVPLEVGYAVRPTISYNSSVRLPGYENGCWELLSTTTTGTLCGILSPAGSCAQSVCNTTTTTTTAP